MTSGGLVLLCRTALVACLLAPVGLADPAKGQAPPEAPAPAPATAPPLVEAFQKGPKGINARVTRSLASSESVRLPLALSFPASAAARPDLPAVVPPVPAGVAGVPVAVPGPSGTGNISP
jgi:hypothetical protein